MGAVCILQAICNFQRTIVNCPKGMKDKEDFVDNKIESLTRMDKKDRDLVLMTELKELHAPNEFIITLFREELNKDSFRGEKQPYRKRQNLLLVNRSLSFLLEQQFEVLMNINLCKEVIFPTLKEMVLEQYLSDIDNDMMVCLIRTGMVIMICKFLKSYLTA